MSVKIMRGVFSIVLGMGLLFQALLGAGVTPVQAAAAINPQWVKTFGPFTGSVANAGYGKALSASSSGYDFVVGASSETVGGNAGQGAAYVYTRSGDGWTSNTLHASDGGAGDHFGISVAISGDGSTVLVGAYQDTISGTEWQGSAYVFVKSGSDWIQQYKLFASDGAAHDFFGSAVALNADGSTALVGAIGYSPHHPSQGTAYVFTRAGVAWSQQTTNSLTAYDAAAADWLGSSVSLSGDGNTALVAARAKTSGQGAAYVYVRSTVDSSWSFQHKIVAWDGLPGIDFGCSVSLSSDGNVALIGADNASAPASLSGAAYTFTRSGATWSDGVKRVASDVAVNDYFGYSVSLSSDGATAVIGSIQADINGASDEGAAYVFFGPGFLQEQKLVASVASAGDNIGAAVTVAGDASMVMVGSPNLTVSVTHAGGVYLFGRLNSPWWQRLAVSNSSGNPSDDLGSSLAMSTDGSTAVIGSDSMNKISIYRRSFGMWTLQVSIPSPDANSVDFGYSLAISGNGDTILVGAPDATVGANSQQGAAYLINWSGSSWSAPAKVVALDGSPNDEFGCSVALSPDGTTAAIGAYGASSKTGAVYVMTRPGSTWSALTRLGATIGAINNEFGYSVALSGDGNTLLVGARFASNGTVNSGAAYVFVRSMGGYSQQIKLAPALATSQSNYGISVALSSDGNTVLIGSPYSGAGTVVTGLAYFYVRSAGLWSLQKSLTAPDLTHPDEFGIGVALSADGNIAVIGNPNAIAYGSLNQGAAYVYTRSVTLWSLQAKVISPDGVPSEFDSNAVAISGDGHTILFDASNKQTARGGVYFFVDNPSYPAFLPWVKR